MIANKWEQDITDSRYFVEAISKSISIYNDIVKDCNKDSTLDICKLKNEKVKPLIDEIFTKAHAIFESIKRCRENGKVKIEPQRKCSDRFYKAMVYLVSLNSADHKLLIFDLFLRKRNFKSLKEISSFFRDLFYYRRFCKFFMS